MKPAFCVEGAKMICISPARADETCIPRDFRVLAQLLGADPRARRSVRIVRTGAKNQIVGRYHRSGRRLLFRTTAVCFDILIPPDDRRARADGLLWS